MPIYKILNIGIELLKRIKTLHSHGIIHRDIKPSNILYGNFSTFDISEKNALYIVDYGLSCKYICINNNHYEYSITQKFVGTHKFASRHSLNTEKLSRRDDVESIFYVLIFLFKGNLPWEEISKKYHGVEKYEKIRDNMIDIDIKTFLNGLPNVFKFIYKNIIML